MEGSHINRNKVPDRVVKIELISFFAKYPETIGSSRHLSEQLGREEQQTKRQMDELVQLGILAKKTEPNEAFYSYIPAVSAKLSRKKPRIMGPSSGEITQASRSGIPARTENVTFQPEETFEEDLRDANGSA